MTSDEIRSARETLGLAKSGLAEALGVTVRAVQMWEAGSRHPSASAIRLIARLIRDQGRKRRK